MRCQSCKFSAVCLSCVELPGEITNRLLNCRKCRDIWMIEGEITKSLRFVRVCSVYTVCDKVWGSLQDSQMSMNLCPTCMRKTEERYITLTNTDRKIITTVRKDNIIEKMCWVPGKGRDKKPDTLFLGNEWLPGKGWYTT